jgi:hypothetical protein
MSDWITELEYAHTLGILKGAAIGAIAVGLIWLIVYVI